MNGNSERGGLSPNEVAIMEKELTSRGMLNEFKDKNPDLANNEKIVHKSGDLIKMEVIHDDKENKAWHKNIDYVRKQNPDNDNKWENTKEIKAVSEQVFERDKQGLITKETGTNLDREHSYEKEFTYDDQGNLLKENGEVTEGEKKGENREKTETKGKVGNYEMITTINVGEKMVKGELVEFMTKEINFENKDGIQVYGYHETDGKKTMDWGKRPDDLDKKYL